MNAGAPLPLPAVFQHILENRVRKVLHADEQGLSFLEPPGEEAFYACNSVSWRIFKNPLALFIGGVAAVLLELAEPRVRTGVWKHSGFRSEPLKRIRRTGLAAMTTVYGPKSSCAQAIERVNRIHETIHGQTPTGQDYHANDPELLAWVHITAAFSFSQAYSTYVCPLSESDFDRFFQEGRVTARLYGATSVPASSAEMQTRFASMQTKLEPSTIVLEFLEIMQKAPIFPRLFQPLQRVLVRAAVDIVPANVRQLLGLAAYGTYRVWETALVRRIGETSDRVVVRSSPAVQSCVRLGLPEDYLYRDPPK